MSAERPLIRPLTLYGCAAAVVALLTLLGILVSEAHCEERSPLVLDAAPLFLASGADYASTRYAIGTPGVSELNPLGQTDARRIVLKSATAVGTTFVVRRLRSRGHPGQARALKYAAIVAQFAAAGWNIRNARRAR